MLCLQNCLVDSNWTVKLTNFVTEEIIGDKLKHNELKLMVIKVKKEKKKRRTNGKSKDKDKDKDKDNDKSNEDSSSSESEEDAESKAQHVRALSKKYIQLAPEIIREIITSKCVPGGTQPADIYSLG
jgi:hypothetical protein